MKNIFTLLFIAFIASNAAAQNDLYLDFNHLWNGNAFVQDVEVLSNNGSAIKVGRLEFYLSGFSIQHDGGQVTEIDDQWLLVRPEDNESFYLGNFDIDQVEAITFSCGVEEEYNHLDPSTYAVGHPLAPQNPSMHWGWASGYRFIAFEGTSGAAFSQIWEIHALGDAHYIEQTVYTGAENISGDLRISLDGNYANLLGALNVSNGMIEHSETGQTINAVFNNMQNSVFTASDGTVNIVETERSSSISIFPNPSDGEIKIKSDSPLEMIQVFNAQGQIVYELNIAGQFQNVLSLETLPAGIYTLLGTVGSHQETQQFILK
jgi:hypothetical protein